MGRGTLVHSLGSMNVSPMILKKRSPAVVRIQGRGVAGTVAAKVKHLFGLCKEFEEKMCKVSAKKQVYLFFLPSRSHFYAKSVEMEAIFNRCWVWEIQNAAFTNQSWASTHQGSWGEVRWFTL